MLDFPVAGELLRAKHDRVQQAAHSLLASAELPAMNSSRCGVAASGYTDDTVSRHGAFDAQDAFLQKPVKPQELAKKVRELLEK